MDTLRSYFRSGRGDSEPSRDQVGTEYGIESPISHGTSNLEAVLDLSSNAFTLSFLQVNHLEMFIKEDSIPVRNQFHVDIVNFAAFPSIFQTKCSQEVSV